MLCFIGSITKTQSGKSTKYTANNICLIMPSKAKLVEVTGFFQYEGSNGQIDLNLSFDNNNNKNKKATITGRYKIQENSYNSQWDFKHTMYPNLDFHIDINSALANDVVITNDYIFKVDNTSHSLKISIFIH